MLKRMLAILMVLAMLLSIMSVGVFAAEEENAVTSETSEDASGESSEASTEASAAVFTVEVSPKSHPSDEGVTTLNIYLSADQDAVVGSFQFTVNVAEDVTSDGYTGTGTVGEDGVIAYLPENEEGTIAVGTEPVLLGTVGVTGTYVAGTSVTLSNVEVNEWDTDSTEAGTAQVVYTTYHGSDAATVWTATDTLPTEAGHYYLTDDVSLSAQAAVSTGDIVLCLNGHTVSADTTSSVNDRAYNLSGDASLTICDCTAHTDEEGNYVAGKVTGAKHSAIKINASATAVVNLYDGIFTDNAGTGTAMMLMGGTFNMYGGQISGNSTASAGGVYVQNAVFNMYGGKIVNNTVTKNGGAVQVTSGTFTMEGGEISGNTATSAGGGIYQLAGEVSIYGGEISNNKAVNGGGVSVAGGKLTINNNGEISHNTASTYGGGIHLNNADGSVIIAGGKVSNNAVTAYHGGGVGVQSGSLAINGGEISGNTAAANNGGGVYIAEGTLTIGGGKISGNSAVNGGGVTVAGGTLTVNSGEISGNTANTYGGGIHLNNADSSVVITGGKISNNTVTAYHGGGVGVQSGNLTISGGEISGNAATVSNGGGVYIAAGKLTVTGGTLSGNTAGNMGGGVCVSSTTAGTIENCTITGNTAKYGGGVGQTAGTITIKSGEVSGNTASTMGGGVYVKAGIFSVNGGKISNNEASYGGGLYLQGTSFAIYGSAVISGNKAVLGAGMVLKSGSLGFNGSTISGNTAQSVGGGLLLSGGTLTLKNNAVIDNNTSTEAACEQNLFVGADVTDPAVTFSGLGTSASIGISAEISGSLTRTLVTVDKDYSAIVTADEPGYTLAYNEDNTQLIMTAPVGSVDSWSLSLGDDIGVNFYATVSDIDNTQMRFTVNGQTTTVPASDVPVVGGKYVFTAAVAAAQMNDTITAELVVYEETVQTGTYTVRQYADVILSGDYTETAKTLVKEMLNYGAVAQTYFSYNTENLANAGIEGAGTQAVPETAEAEIAVSGSAEGVRFYGAALVFGSKTAVRFYFQADDISTCTFTVGGKTLTATQKDDVYYVEVSGIDPQDLADAITLSVNGTLTVTYAPMNYVVRMNVSGSDNLKALLKALYNYYLAAVEYTK